MISLMSAHAIRLATMVSCRVVCSVCVLGEQIALCFARRGVTIEGLNCTLTLPTDIRLAGSVVAIRACHSLDTDAPAERDVF